MRRRFLAALATWPFLGALVRAEPEHTETGGVEGKPQYMALLIWKDGKREQRNYPTPPGREVYEPTGSGTLPFWVAFRATGQTINLRGGPQFKVYKEV